MGDEQAPRYDLVIIGSGPGGYVAAIRAGQLGLKTAIVEKSRKLGGTCLHRGCIPTKAMLHTATLLEEARQGRKFGVVTAEVQLDLERMHAYKDRVVNKNAKGIEFLMKKNGVAVVHGEGRLETPGRVLVTAPDGAERRLEARHIIVATGSVCRDLPTFPVDHERILDSDDMFHIQAVPESLVVVGAGAVGVEFASMFQRFGSRVTLIEMLPRILPLEDEEISDTLTRALSRRGLKILTNATVTGVTRTEGGVHLEVKVGEGTVQPVEATHLLVAVGRAPVTQDIGLENTAAVVERGYIRVDSFMETDQPGLFAIGDVVDTPQLAHVASAEGILAVEHMAGRPCYPIDYDHVPSCTYCAPEVASVGLTEAEARARGYEVRVGRFPYPVNAKAAILGERDGLVKVVTEKRYDELLGIHIVGAGATNLIAEGVAALDLEATTEALARVIHPHPTLSEAILEGAHAALGHAIHI